METKVDGGTFRRIVVIGSAGSGKSTLARVLAERLDRPHIELDAFYWGTNWTPRDLDEFVDRTEEAIEGDQWVVDGNYRAVREPVWSRADTLIWLDFPLWLCLWRVLRRTLKRALWREVLWGTNRERIGHLFDHDSLIRWLIRSHAKRRAEWETMTRIYDHLEVVRLRSPKEAKRWLAAFTSTHDNSCPTA